MTNRLLHTILRRTDGLLADATPDSDLVRRFVESRDEAAFAVLVQRHGPMAWAVCRQMLPNPADSDDAFQAVFVALVQSAAKLGRVTSLGGWLHGVAVRVCLKARRGGARRRTRERASAKPEATRPTPEWADLHAAVHEEVERLPESLRTAFVLCDLQGVRQPDAAARLGWKLGTVSGRLTRARQLLLKKLTARGLAPAVAVGVTAGSGLPAALAEQAVVLARSGAAGGVEASSTVLELARGATEGMMTKVKWTVGSVLLVGGLMVSVGSGWLPTADAQRPAADPKPATAPKAAETAYDEPTRAEDRLADLADEPPPATSAAAPTPKPYTRSTGPAPSAQRFEHLVVNRPATAEALRTLFQEKEKQGWEYIGIIGLANPADLQLVFKRPKGGAVTTAVAPTAVYPYRTAAGETGETIPATNSTRSPDLRNADAGRYAPSPAYPNARSFPTTPSADADPTATIPAGASRTPSAIPSPAVAPAPAPKATPAPTADPNTIPARREELPADTAEAKLPSGFETVKLKHAKATDVAKTLRELFATETGGMNREPFTVSGDDRTGTVIFKAGRGASSNDVKAMIKKLDTPTEKKPSSFTPTV